MKKAALSLGACSICSSVSRFNKETPSVSGASRMGGALGNAHKFLGSSEVGAKVLLGLLVPFNFIFYPFFP
jgi:hypothetical protein